MMESVNLEMDDLFDTGNDNDDGEDFGALPAALPDMEDGDAPMAEGQEDNEEGEDGEDGVIANLQRLSKGAAKKKVMKPQPKLDAERLKSDRGLPVLPTLFDDVKFKGKGHEAADLKILMSKLEHWGHRLFPKLQFDEFTDRLEKLGGKKPVQTTLKRIRLDMPILDSEYVQQYDEEQEGAGEAGEDEPVQKENEMDAEAAYDAMLRHERELLGADEPSSTGDVTASGSQASQGLPGAGHASPSTSQVHPSDRSSNGAASTAEAASKQSSGAVSDEQKNRMEQNKLIAMQKRAARLGVAMSTLMSPDSKSSSQPPASGDDKPPSQSSAPRDTDEVPGVAEVTGAKPAGGASDRLIPQSAASAVDTSPEKPVDSADQPAAAYVLQTADELLAGLNDSDLDDGVSGKPAECGGTPGDTEALKRSESGTCPERLSSMDSDMESINLHLTLDTTATDDDTCPPSGGGGDTCEGQEVDKENKAGAGNAVTAAGDSQYESEVFKQVDKGRKSSV